MPSVPPSNSHCHPPSSQVVSTVVTHYTRGLPPLTFSAPGKVPPDYWGKSSGEADLVFHK
jgi:DNA-directed RNA polymerase I subunit RPA1